jgi:hypothetical protein
MRRNFDGTVREDLTWREVFDAAAQARLRDLLGPARLERFDYTD